MRELTCYERRKIALEALVAEKSVIRTYRDPDSVRESTWIRIREAARRLGLLQPPPPRDNNSLGILAQ